MGSASGSNTPTYDAEDLRDFAALGIPDDEDREVWIDHFEEDGFVGDDGSPLDPDELEALGDLSFGVEVLRPAEPIAPEAIDRSSYERWVQSILKATVAPEMAVDGVIGPITKRAVKRFQATAHQLLLGGRRLAADGVVGKNTIAALEAVSGTTMPTGREADRGREPVAPQLASAALAAPPAAFRSSDTLAHRVEKRDGRSWHVVSAYGDEVRFRYRGPTDRTAFRDYYQVWSYEGAKTDLLTDDDILSIGYTASGMRVMKANSFQETRGKFGAVNTWDDQIFSWGACQFAGHAGTLARLLTMMRRLDVSAEAYQRWFADNGVDVDDGPYEWLIIRQDKWEPKKGSHVVVTTDGGTELRGDHGWMYIRKRPELVGAFMLAGNDKAILLGQLAYWKERFFDAAVRRKVHGDQRYGDYVTSEFGMALGVRLTNWMPAYLARWFADFVRAHSASYAGGDLWDPAVWQADPSIEQAMCKSFLDRRRRVKKGSWDRYALNLSRERGSFVA